MNLAVLHSSTSLIKGHAFIASVFVSACHRFQAMGEDLDDEKFVALIGETLFTILENSDARTLIEIYFIQMHANVLFVDGHYTSWEGSIMKARDDVQDFLSFQNLSQLAKRIQLNWDELLTIWQQTDTEGGGSIENLDRGFQNISSALDMTIQTLVLEKAA